jgi:hypothetical protein
MQDLGPIIGEGWGERELVLVSGIITQPKRLPIRLDDYTSSSLAFPQLCWQSTCSPPTELGHKISSGGSMAQGG